MSANDPVAFSCVFGISRAGAVWCPVNPRNEAAENRDVLDFFDCRCLIFSAAFAPLVTKILPELPKLTTLVCLDGEHHSATPFRQWIADLPADPWQAEPPDDIVMLVGTEGTTGRPKGVMLTGHNIETMSALTLMSYPFGPRPRYLALAPLTHAAGVLCFPVMTLGGQIVIMPAPDLTEFLALVEKDKITHTFLPPTPIYMLLDHDRLAETDTGSLQCLWYGAAPMSASRLEEALTRIGPVLGQLFGQSEAPMMISTLAPADHFRDDGSLATERLSCAGRPTPLSTVAIMDDEGRLLGPGQRGEIVVRGPLVMAGYYKNPQASAEAARHGWHHTGDIGYLDEDNYLFIVDRAKDMIITGGFNVYSAEVEQVLLAHPAVQDCAVIGLIPNEVGACLAQLQAVAASSRRGRRAHARIDQQHTIESRQLEHAPHRPAGRDRQPQVSVPGRCLLVSQHYAADARAVAESRGLQVCDHHARSHGERRDQFVVHPVGIVQIDLSGQRHDERYVRRCLVEHGSAPSSCLPSRLSARRCPGNSECEDFITTGYMKSERSVLATVPYP